MIKKFGLLILLIFLSNCSLDSKTGIWTKTENIQKDKKEKKKQIEKKILFLKEEFLKKELNPNLKIKLFSKSNNNSFTDNLNNNNGRVNYNGKLKKISKFKYKKIDGFYYFEPEIIFHKDNVIFFDNKGSILNFNKLSKVNWKKNFYKKAEKKTSPILFFGVTDNTLIVADNLSKYYALNINTGDLLWSKKSLAPFNSQIKTYKDKFFVVDFENILRCFSVIDGKEIWKVKTEKSFIQSQKKLSLVIVNEMVYFINSIGDINAVDIESGNLIWQSPTRSDEIFDDSFTTKNSDLVADDQSIYFSNTKNEFYSFDIKSGALNWKQSINSNVRPTIIDDLIFTVSLEGYLIIIDKNNGNIIRITNIFDRLKLKYLIRGERSVTPVGFIVGNDMIYLTTDTGKLIIIDILSGRSTNVLKIDRDKISRPFIVNQNLFIIKDNSIIKIN